MAGIFNVKLFNSEVIELILQSNKATDHLIIQSSHLEVMLQIRHHADAALPDTLMLTQHGWYQD